MHGKLLFVDAGTSAKAASFASNGPFVLHWRMKFCGPTLKSASE